MYDLRIFLQATTPTPSPTIWQLTQDQVPYVVIIGLGILAFFFGFLLRPLLEDVGDALRRVVRGLGRSSDFRQRYLTYLISQNRHLPLLPANVVTGRWEYRRKAIELEELYTPLSLGGDGSERDEFRIDDEFRRRRQLNRVQRWWRRLWTPPKPTAGDTGPIIANNPRLVVRGDPGSGKSTLLRYLALTCARSLRGDRRDGDQRQLVQRRLGWKLRPLPILVNLNLMADVANWPPERRLIDEIVDTLPGELRSRYPAGFFERELAHGNCLVLLDGFDELGSRTARGRMAQLVADMTGAYHGRNQRQGNSFVVSTRIVGYEGQLNAYGFTVRTVEELDAAAVRTLVQRRYRAIAVGEALGRSPQEQRDLQTRYAERAEQLLGDLRRNEGLAKLTTNPLLLSLIVLVHQVQVVLPEQRHLLYRDCVEILTEKWRASQRDALGMVTAQRPDALALPQKIELLQEIALTMQMQRGVGDGLVVIPRSAALAIVSRRLPNYLAAFLPEAADARAQECQRRATALLDSIHVDSGILVEKGLDAAGDPVVGFSHLTFQEYLAAAAIRAQPATQPALIEHLFEPAWREVLLLYVAMGNASEVVRACLTDLRQLALARYLLAGRCLAEKITVEPALRQEVVRGLNAYFGQTAAGDADPIGGLVERIGGENNFDWLIFRFLDNLPAMQQQAFATVPDGAFPLAGVSPLQQGLLAVMQQASESQSRYTAGCILSGVGDPRDLEEMLEIPAGPFTMGSEEYSHEQPVHTVNLAAYAIGKYPVTNRQYAAFVAATNHRAPRHWHGAQCPPWLASHPVVYVSWHDAVAYCGWLTRAQGRVYRLPSEAEWEKAARGPATGSGAGRSYPWGDQPPTDRLCNFNMNVGDTTAVGSYPDGASPYGAQDMAGNVWEWTGSLWGKDGSRPEYAYPYTPNDGRENLNAPDSILRTLRGGSFGSFDSDVRCAYRDRFSPGGMFFNVGFRVVSPGF